jgi:hypothetical protein
MAKNDSISSLVVVPSWGDHPDDPVEALKAAYWPHSNVAKDANFVIHRQSDGQVVVTETGAAVKDGSALVVFLGRGQRQVSAEELAAFEEMVSGLRKSKRISGRLKQNINGDLRFKENDMPDQPDNQTEDLPANRDTTPPEVVVEAEPDPEPEDEDEEDEDDEGRAETRAPSKA